jgi:hypothetical protein
MKSKLAFWRVAIVVGIGLIVAGSLAWLAVAAPAARPSGFVQDDHAVNTNVSRDALRPSIGVGTLTGSTSPGQFVAFTQNTFNSQSRDVFVSQFAANQWQVVGAGANDGSLNIDRSKPAEHPDIDFAGANRGVLWATWAEPAAGIFNNMKQIFAARLDTAANRWQAAGEDLGGGHPSLNINTVAEAENPRIAGGATSSGENPRPWVIWEEDSLRFSNAIHIFVKRAVPDTSAMGGFRWEIVGQNRISPPGAPLHSLNVDLNRSAHDPDIAFADTVPWAVWYEEGSGRAQRVFAARAVGDFSQPDTVEWQPVPACGGSGGDQNCALNRDPFQDAFDPRIAIGPAPGTSTMVPWVVFVQKNASGRNLIYVSRFDPDGNRFIAVGGALNLQPFFPGSVAEYPDIAFAGKVPFVTWTENLGQFKRTFVRHLADARPGFERWDLDTSPTGINVESFRDAFTPAITTNGVAPFVTWQEGQEVFDISRVVEKHLEPSGGSWGSNYPPYIRIISSSIRSAVYVAPPVGLLSTAPSQVTVGPDLVLTTTCNNFDGWNNITDIYFQITDGTTEIFQGRFQNPNMVSVYDPDSGEWSEPQTIGSGSPISTRYAVLDVPNMELHSFGPNSPALDIIWHIMFKPSVYTYPLAPKTYQQNLRILSTTSPDTDFFQVGEVFIGYQAFLPFLGKP